MKQGNAISRAKVVRLAVTAIIFAMVATLYFAVDPLQSRWIPKCAFKAFTGHDCPGCGSQRMLHALLHGDIAAAWEANAFVLAMLPVLVLMAVSARWRQRWPRLYAALNSPAAIILISILLAAWTAWRF